MTKGNVVGEEFEQYVFDQIDVRQSLHGAGSPNSEISRDPKILNYLNNRNTWVKMASSVDLIDKINGKDLPELSKGINRLKSISKDLGDSKSGIEYKNYQGSGLSKNFVLFNTLSNLNFKDEESQEFSNYTFRSGIQKSQQSWLDVDSSYGFGGTAMGLQPTPGIIDVSIDCVNRGSIRKATVTLKAFNRYQFSIIEMLYLRLGYTMMLEWGWDRYASEKKDGTYEIKNTETTLIEDLWFKNQTDESPITQIEMIQKIEDKRDYYEGNYDGFYGKVNNFTWNFNPDGSYDITINLTTLGDVVESLKVNTSAPIAGADDLEGFQKLLTDQGLGKDSLQYDSMGNDILSRYLNTLILQHQNENTKEYPLISYKEIPGVTEEWTLARSGDTKYGEKDQLPNSELTYFIRLGSFLDIISKEILPKLSEKESIVSIETDPDANYIKSYLNQIPFDPKVCLFTVMWGKNFLETYSTLKDKEPFKEINEGLPEKFTVEEGGFVAGKLMNIYLNINFLLRILKDISDEKGNLSLYKLVESICNELNRTLGGFNNLEPVIKDDRTLVIIDQNPIPGLSKILKTNTPNKQNPKIEVFGYNKGKSNFLKDIKFQTKIDNSLASMISIGATADGTSTKNYDATAFSKWNIGLKDRFKPQFKDPKGNISSEGETATGRDLAEYRKGARDYASRNLEKNTSAKWYLKESSSYPTTRGSGIIRYVRGNETKEMVINEFIADSVKAIREKDIQTYEKDELERLTKDTYVGYLHYIFGVDFESYLSKTNKSIETFNTYPKYHNLFSNGNLVGKGKTTFNAFINNLSNEKFKENKEPSGNIGFIPVSFDLTLEGLSGVKIYNKLNIDTRFLPSNYGNALDFLITKVNHKISNNNWDTVLGTTSTSNLSESTPDDSSLISTSGDFDNIRATTFSELSAKTIREMRGDNYTNGEIPEDKLRTINKESQYKGNIQSDGGKIRLFPDASIALDKLLEKSEKDGIKFQINSAYRTFKDQVRVRKVYPEVSAKPGTSNHGFAVAVDFARPGGAKIIPSDQHYKWLVENAVNFGFKRLPINPTKGEAHEAWHWEYQISEYSNDFTEWTSSKSNYYLGTNF